MSDSIKPVGIVKYRPSPANTGKFEIKTMFNVSGEEVFLLVYKTKEGWIGVSKTYSRKYEQIYNLEYKSEDFSRIIKKHIDAKMSEEGISYDADKKGFILIGGTSMIEVITRFLKFYIIVDYVDIDL